MATQKQVPATQLLRNTCTLEAYSFLYSSIKYTSLWFMYVCLCLCVCSSVVTSVYRSRAFERFDGYLIHALPSCFNPNIWLDAFLFVQRKIYFYDFYQHFLFILLTRLLMPVHLHQFLYERDHYLTTIFLWTNYNSTVRTRFTMPYFIRSSEISSFVN